MFWELYFCFIYRFFVTYAGLLTTTLIPNSSIYNEFIYYYYFSDKRRKIWFLKRIRKILWHRISAYYIFQPTIYVVVVSFRWKHWIWWLSSGLWVCATVELLYVYILYIYHNCFLLCANIDFRFFFLFFNKFSISFPFAAYLEDFECQFWRNGSDGFVNRTDIRNETVDMVIQNSLNLDCLWMIEVEENWRVSDIFNFLYNWSKFFTVQ